MPIQLIITVGVLAFILLISAVKILNEYERGVVFRLGRYVGTKGPGLILLIPGIDKMVKMELRTVTLDQPRSTLFVIFGLWIPLRP